VNETKFFINDGGKTVEKIIPIEKAAELYKNNLTDTYPPWFYKNSTKCKDWQIGIGKTIGEMYNIESVVDFGCGLGYYLEGFQMSGAKIKGYEISYDNAKDYMSKSVLPYVEKGNVMEKIKCEPFHLSMSIEVAEHILPDKSSFFVDNLARASKQYVLLTAAPPGQGGVCHINEQNMSYWIKLMDEKGFEFSECDTEKIRHRLSSLPYNGKYYSIIKKHMSLFRRKNDT